MSIRWHVTQEEYDAAPEDRRFKTNMGYLGVDCMPRRSYEPKAPESSVAADAPIDPNDTSKDVRNGFICAAWTTRAEGPILDFEKMTRRIVVFRCDRPDGHRGDHVDKVLLVNWPDSENPHEHHLKQLLEAKR